MKKKKIYADLGAITKDGKNFFYSASWPVNEKTFGNSLILFLKIITVL